MGGVVPVLYRHVARLARLHDRDPALKALLLLVPTKEYDWRERRCRLSVEEQRRCLGVEVSPRSSGRPPAAASLGQLARPPSRSLGRMPHVCRTQVGGA